MCMICKQFIKNRDIEEAREMVAIENRTKESGIHIDHLVDLCTQLDRIEMLKITVGQKNPSLKAVLS